MRTAKSDGCPLLYAVAAYCVIAAGLSEERLRSSGKR
jgi:hypothetical protein